jgi:hypothetical protein
MNITREFAGFMENEGFGTVGQDIFLSTAPKSPDKCFWLLSGGGSPEINNETGEKVKNYLISVFMRDIDTENVYDTLQDLEEAINRGDCKELDGYEVVEITATLFPTDQDLDNEDRTVGLLQVSCKTYL